MQTEIAADVVPINETFYRQIGKPLKSLAHRHLGFCRASKQRESARTHHPARLPVVLRSQAIEHLQGFSVATCREISPAKHPSRPHRIVWVESNCPIAHFGTALGLAQTSGPAGIEHQDLECVWCKPHGGVERGFGERELPPFSQR